MARVLGREGPSGEIRGSWETVMGLSRRRGFTSMNRIMVSPVISAHLSTVEERVGEGWWRRERFGGQY